MRIDLGETVVTRKNGSFAMKCRRPDDAGYSLEVEAEGYVQAADVSVSPGDRNVVATLARPGVLEGHWRAPRGLLLPDDIRVVVEAENGATVFDSGWESAARDARFSGWMAREWTGFSMGGLAPGWYSLELRLRDTPRMLARLDGLLVHEGTTTLDPRLDPIDLSASLRVFLLDARGPDGARPLALRVQSRSEGWPYWRHDEALRLRDGRFRILAPDPALDLLVAANGYRDLALEDVRSDTFVHLEPGLDVRIVLEDPPAIPWGDTLYLSLMPRDSTAYEIRREAATVGPDHSARFALPRPGRYAASLSFRPSGEMDFGSAAFQVLEGTEPQEMSWSGARAAILEALENGRR